MLCSVAGFILVVLGLLIAVVHVCGFWIVDGCFFMVSGCLIVLICLVLCCDGVVSLRLLDRFAVVVLLGVVVLVVLVVSETYCLWVVRYVVDCVGGSVGCCVLV